MGEAAARGVGKPAAQYLRMSTEHQRYSPEFQRSAIALYAEANGFEIVRTYFDEGISGLTIKKRRGLQQLLADVLTGDCGFRTVLVYDVSRWGRFQNPDQAAHYEFLCSEAGVTVEYCGELFRNDGSLSSTVLKGLKRAMAAEYSRELSAKVAATRRGLLLQGYWQGGVAGYGLRRQMVNPDGTLGAILQYGEQKALRGRHVILVPGPAHEIAVVKRIYQMFAVMGVSRARIANILNAEGLTSESGAPWTFHTVKSVLTNPKYVGELVSNRSTAPLGARPVPSDEANVVRKPGAFQPIISQAMFKAAAKRVAATRPITMTRQQLIEAARGVYERHGRITMRLIDDTPRIPSSTAFIAQFGSVPGVYEAIGRSSPYKPRRPRVRLDDAEILRRLAQLYKRVGYLTRDIINDDPRLPGVTTLAVRFGRLDNAYVKVGFIQSPAKVRNSAVGRARMRAARLRLEALLAEQG